MERSSDRIQVQVPNAPDRRSLSAAYKTDPNNLTRRIDTNLFIQVSTPILQLFAGIGKRHEPVRVQAFRPELAVERFYEAIVRRLASLSLFSCKQLPGSGAREIQCHAVRIGPKIHISGDELAAIIDPVRLRIADLSAHAFKRLDHILATVREPWVSRRAITRMRIDYRQDAQFPTGCQLIMNEVHRLSGGRRMLAFAESPNLVRSNRLLAIVTQLRLNTALGMLVSQLQP